MFCHYNNSILNTNTTGFGGNNQLVFRHGCQADSLWTPLFKEAFLSEFTTASEKQQVLENLGILDDDSIKSLIEQYLQGSEQDIIQQILNVINNGTSGGGESSGDTPTTPDDSGDSGDVDDDSYDQYDDGEENF